MPLALRTTVALLIGCPLPFLTVTVMVAVPLPTGIEAGAAATVESVVDTGLGLTVTFTVLVIAVPFAVAETILAPATVEASVPVATPFASVRAIGCVRTFPLPVADSTTAAPASA